MATSQTIDTPARKIRRPPASLSRDSTRTLRSGSQMPVLGLGTWLLTSHTADAVAHALRSGYRMIDTAPDYSTQPGIRAALAQLGYPRNELFITSKVEADGDAFAATQRNLEELRIEYADLMLIHEPPERGVGVDAWRALIRARGEGLVHDIGVCGYEIDQLRELAEQTGEMPAVHQMEWSPFGHSLDMLAFCEANEIQLQAYSPLTHGKRLDDGRLAELASRYGKSPAQLIIRWNLQHGVVPLPKATRADHQRENLDVFDFDIDAEDMKALDAFESL